MNKTIRVLLAALLFGTLFAGCSEQAISTTQPLKPGDYAAILPYEVSDTRAKHIGLIADIDIRTQLELGLMDLSKTYFPPSEVAYKTHAFLDYDELDATDQSRGLLGRLKDNNPNGLNPGADEDFDTGNGIVKGPVLVVDLYELDFYDQNTLKGISIGLAVPDSVEENGQHIEITREKMEEFLKATGAKIVSYMRERFNEITPDIPILIAAYQMNLDDSSSSKGGYMFTELFKGTSETDAEVVEEYMLIPSAAFSQAQPQLASEFETFRQDIAKSLSDTSFTVGEARVQNGAVQKMTLTVSAYGKTVGETLAVIQNVREKLAVFTDENILYKVVVENNGKMVALLDRDPKSKDVQVLTVY